MISETAYSSQTKLIGLSLPVSEHGLGYLTPDPQGARGAQLARVPILPTIPYNMAFSCESPVWLLIYIVRRRSAPAGESLRLLLELIDLCVEERRAQLAARADVEGTKG